MKPTRESSKVLTIIARILLVVTFIEDAVRISSQWKDQVNFFSNVRGMNSLMSHLFLLLTVVSLVIFSLMAVLNQKQLIACCGLALCNLFQTIAYGSVLNLMFVSRSIALIGSLLMLLASSIEQKQDSVFSGLTIEMNQTNKKGFTLLIGRLMLVSLFISEALVSDSNFVKKLAKFTLLFCSLMVILGFKVKIFSISLIFVLTLNNFIENNYWTLSDVDQRKDFVKYDFFHTFSLIGGLLMLLNLGPGKLSLDQKSKKEY